MSEKEKKEVVKKYNEAFDEFVNSSGSAQNLVVRSGDLIKNMDLLPGGFLPGGMMSAIVETSVGKKTEPDFIEKLISQYVVEPKLAEIAPAPLLYESTEFMKSMNAQYYTLGTAVLSDKTATQQFAEELNRAEKTYQDASKEVTKDMPEEQATEYISEYYRSVMDIQFGAQNMRMMAQDFSHMDENSIKSGKVTPLGIWDKIKSVFRSMQRKIEQIMVRLKTFARDTGSSVSKSLIRLEEVLKSGAEKIQQLPGEIVSVFKELADTFMEFVGTLIERMFNFLSKFGVIAKKAGYSVSKIEVKLPKISLTRVNILAVIDIPIPTIDAPDITLTITNMVGKN